MRRPSGFCDGTVPDEEPGSFTIGAPSIPAAPRGMVIAVRGRIGEVGGVKRY